VGAEAQIDTYRGDRRKLLTGAAPGAEQDEGQPQQSAITDASQACAAVVAPLQRQVPEGVHKATRTWGGQ
jgi:hypothetical protein